MATIKAGKTANPKQLTEKQQIAATEKAYKAIVKSAKIDLKQESVSVSFWIKHIIKGGKDINKALKHRLGLKALPKNEELIPLCVKEALRGFKFYDKETQSVVLNCRKRFEKDSNGNPVLEDGKPVVAETWYIRKETFTFNAVYTALFTPSKTVVYIDGEDIRETE